MRSTGKARAGIALGGFLAVLCMAPTPGDVGGCGATVTELNVVDYAYARKAQDCERCHDCSLSTGRCTRACDPAQPADVSIPTTCRPLEHDGEVCIRALHAASCGTYASYVADKGASTPSECDFCQDVAAAPSGSFAVDAGTEPISDAGAER